MAKKTAVEEKRVLSESEQRILAHAVAHRRDPFPDRGSQMTAFDHDTIGRGGGGSVFANSADRVKLCAPEKPCRMCRERAALAGR